MELTLVRPTEGDEKALLDYKAEHFAHGETELHGGALLDHIDCFSQWLKLIRGNTRPESVLPGWVPADTLLAVRIADRRLIGMIDIRRELNDFLRNCGGHIGYGVRPSERRKGYATQMLQLGLAFCRGIPLREVLMVCRRDNLASRRTIEKCGGVLLREVTCAEENELPEVVQMFRIALEPSVCPEEPAGSDPDQLLRSAERISGSFSTNALISSRTRR